MKDSSKLSFCALLLTSVFCACGGSNAGDNPQIELDPAGTDVQMTGVYNVTVFNNGDANLKVLSAPVLSGGLCQDGTTSAFSLEIQSGATFPYVIAPKDTVGEGENAGLALTVRFNDATDLCAKTATLKILSNDADTEELTINITRAVIEPNITVQPNPLDMGLVTVGPMSVQYMLPILNTGLSALEITKVDVIKFAEGFSFQWPCERKSDTTNTADWATDPDARIPIEYDSETTTILTIDDTICAAPVVIQPAGTLEVPVYYTAITADPARVLFRLYSNDPDYNASLGEAYEASVQANFGGPCLTVTPDPLDFGTVTVGTGVLGRNVTLFNCGDETLEITSIEYSVGTSPEFTNDLSELGTFDESHPLTIEPAKSRTFYATYAPTDINKDEHNKLVADEGFLIIGNNSPRQPLEVPVRGLGAEAQCAVCQFEMKNGEVAIADGATIDPQVVITLENHSKDDTVGGGIETNSWTVTQPGDSVSIFVPSSSVVSPTFQPNIVGQYEFCLEVFNNDGCGDKCCQTVNVAPPTGCHIELTWNTPTDLNQADECFYQEDCGADLDLHVVHPLASGDRMDTENNEPYGYFDPKYDCVAFQNRNPTWDMEHFDDPDYQPNFDRDDTDGAGPENFTYAKPDPLYSTTPPSCYRIGVHYYDDHLFGRSYPKVRVFINSSTPVYDRTLESGMTMLDMWDVGRVCCSNGETPFIERVNQDGTPHIVHGYPVSN